MVLRRHNATSHLQLAVLVLLLLSGELSGHRFVIFHLLSMLLTNKLCSLSRSTSEKEVAVVGTMLVASSL